MSHDWLYLRQINGRQVVRCRRCDKFDSYLISGYKPQPPITECSPSRKRLVILVEVLA